MGPAWEPCGPDMGTGSARPRRAALSERAVSSMEVGRLGSSKYLVQWRQSIACTRFALGLPILPESGQRGTSRLADDRGSAAQNLTVYSGTDGNAATVAKTGPPWEPRGFGVLQEIIIRALSMPVDSGPDLPDAAGVRARLLHSCVLVVSSRRDFTFPTAKFGPSTSWNLEHLLCSWTAAILAVFPERRSSCPYSHPRLSTAPDPGLPPLSSLSSSTTKPQATWAPRPISISFSTSTSDSRLSTLDLCYTLSSRTGILFRPKSTPSTRSIPRRQACLLFRRRKSHRTFDPGPVAAIAQLAQYTAA